MAVVKIRGTTIFRDCGSKRNAFISALSVLDYDVTCRAPEGKEAVFWVTAEFHPIWYSLRDIRIVRGSYHSSPHIIPLGSPEAGPPPVRVEQAIEVMFLPEDREGTIRSIDCTPLRIFSEADLEQEYDPEAGRAGGKI